MKLESLARINGFESTGAHSALFDTELTVKVLDLIKQKQPNSWQDILKQVVKVLSENMVKQEKIFTLDEYFFGNKSYRFVCTTSPKCLYAPSL